MKTKKNQLEIDEVITMVMISSFAGMGWFLGMFFIIPSFKLIFLFISHFFSALIMSFLLLILIKNHTRKHERR